MNFKYFIYGNPSPQMQKLIGLIKINLIYFQGMKIEVGLKTIYGFLVVDKQENQEDPIKCNKEYRSWFNKKEIIKISRDAQDVLVMKNSVGEAILLNTSRVLELKRKTMSNVILYPSQYQMLQTTKFLCKVLAMVAFSLLTSLARLLVTSLTIISVNMSRFSSTTPSFNLVNIFNFFKCNLLGPML